MTRNGEISKQFAEVIAALDSESERGRILVMAALLDNALEDCLRARFSREHLPVKMANKLVSSDSSLFGSFWAKITVCRAFGLINHHTYEALDAFRELRNCCAHSVCVITLDSPQAKPYAKVIQRFGKSSLDVITSPGADTPSDLLAFLQDFQAKVSPNSQECRECKRCNGSVSEDSPCLFDVGAVALYSCITILVAKRGATGESVFPIQTFVGEIGGPKSES